MEKAIDPECIAGYTPNGQRLDAALAALFPLLGLRGRRRLWKERLVLVDGIARFPAFRLYGGETLRLVPKRPAGAKQDAFAVYSDDPPRLLARRGDIFFLYKPRGLHTEKLAGSSNSSLADMLGRIVPDVPFAGLLTRLDRDTSGIVLAAADADAALHWRQLENAGGVEKRYLAVLEGRLDDDRLARNALAFTKTRRTRVLDADGPVLRHTRMRPLAYFHTADAPELASGYPDGASFTVALCSIAKGARHQIRAHAAHVGRPLAGDALYGARSGASYFLHHCHIQWPGGQASCAPPWSALLPILVWEQVRLAFFCAKNESVSA